MELFACIVTAVSFILILFVGYIIEEKFGEIDNKIERIEKVLKFVYFYADYDFKQLGYKIVVSDDNKIIYRNKYKESFIVISIKDKKVFKVYDITCPSVQIEFTKQEALAVEKKLREIKRNEE